MGQKDTSGSMKKIGFDVNEKLYKHEPREVVDNDSWKILWDEYNTN